MERYWVSNNVLLNLSDQLGEALPSDKFTPMVKAADAQATIAALQARAEQAERLVALQAQEILQRRQTLGDLAHLHQQQSKELTQRTAELERVRGELQKAERCISEWVDRHSTYFSKLEIDFAKLHALVATLPKVEGEILEQGDLAFVRYVHVDGPLPDIPRHDLIALLKHRQGMEGQS